MTKLALHSAQVQRILIACSATAVVAVATVLVFVVMFHTGMGLALSVAGVVLAVVGYPLGIYAARQAAPEVSDPMPLAARQMSRMRRKRIRLSVVVGVAGITLCSLGIHISEFGSPFTRGNPPRPSPSFNIAMKQVFNPSKTKGGVVKLANAGDWDTYDPGETYYGFSWNFARLYTRALVMFKVAPGAGSNELVPDLAQSLGVPSDGGKTFTYKLRPGLKYEDGSAITSKDVKYAVLRSTGQEDLPQRPGLLRAVPGPAGRVRRAVPDPGHEHRPGHLHAGRHHHRVPPQAGLRRLRLPGAAAADRPGAAG